MNDKIDARHLQRLAAVYVRQSSPDPSPQQPGEPTAATRTERNVRENLAGPKKGSSFLRKNKPGRRVPRIADRPTVSWPRRL